MTFEDDDVPAKTTTATGSTALENANPKPSHSSDNLNVDFGDTDMMSKGDGFDKISPPENDKKRVVRVALLTDVLSPKKDWVHFVTNKGPFRCNSERDAKGLVVKKANSEKKLENDDRQKAQLSVVVLALWYKNADPMTGKYLRKKDRDGNEYVDPIEWELGWVKLSRSGYRRVSQLIQEDQKPHEFDMIISHKDSGIGFDYSVISSKARFRQNAELLEEVLDAAAKFKDGVKLTEKLGKKVSELEFAAVLSGNPVSAAADATVDDVSDL